MNNIQNQTTVSAFMISRGVQLMSFRMLLFFLHKFIMVASQTFCYNVTSLFSRFSAPLSPDADGCPSIMDYHTTSSHGISRRGNPVAIMSYGLLRCYTTESSNRHKPITTSAPSLELDNWGESQAIHLLPA